MKIAIAGTGYANPALANQLLRWQNANPQGYGD